MVLTQLSKNHQKQLIMNQKHEHEHVNSRILRKSVYT